MSTESGESSHEAIGELERHFAPTPESAASARHFVKMVVAGADIDEIDLLLLTSELVTNAIRHAHTSFAVRINIDGDDEVRVTVINHAPELLLVLREPTATSGRGLALIDAIATAWGFERRADTKLAWFSVARQQRRVA